MKINSIQQMRPTIMFIKYIQYLKRQFSTKKQVYVTWQYSKYGKWRLIKNYGIDVSHIST